MERIITDGEGTAWRVWGVSRGQLVPEGMAIGWLAFQSATEERRFYPLPDDWEELRDWQLVLFLRYAVRSPVSP